MKNKTNVVQQAIGYIEDKIFDSDLMAESVANHVGYSVFHFHRLFYRETGFSTTDYIKKRRLTVSSRLLLHSNEPVIMIAFSGGFNSQEAFTRAFKKEFGVTPGKYRTLFRINILNKGVQSKMATKIKGWFLSGSNPDKYETALDDVHVHQGKQAAYIKSTTVSGDDEFATLMQQFKATNFIGKRMRLSGFIKTEDVQNLCGLWMRVDNRSDEVLQFDNMHNRKISGTTNWNYYTIVLDVPNQANSISVGLLLAGKGKVWVDSLKFDEVDLSVDVTNLDFSNDMHEEPVNFSFEE
ncbi:helix-turn-helix transcriptional regulator [Alkalicoccobacillus murimartini]|uniref:AraC-like DNA-binding protein n=1 Tax=Alkalicoccobacillus murimartini TaxID=171685 RepID=A0ABT9YC07_9BACI|nr:AraC family transcriptional regulator [Alkalicoccobacillus murimartini]MDQ0205386.1 AraC-like DNA-binding protein [Alkalicoccobacillus murimartini]